MDLNREINNRTVTVEDFNTSLVLESRLSKKKINEEIMDLNGTYQIDLMDSNKMFYPKYVAY